MSDESNSSAADREAAAIVAQFGSQLRDPAQPFGLLVRFQVQSGLSEAAKAAFAKVYAPTAREEGMLAFDLSAEAGDASRFVMHERWKNLAAFAAHHHTDYIATLRTEIGGMLAAPPEFVVLLPC